MRGRKSAAAGHADASPGRDSVPAAAAPLHATPGIVLTLADAERLRAKCIDLMEFANLVGLAHMRISAHGIKALSAFDAFPLGELDVAKTFACWDYRHGDHKVELFTEFPVLGASPSGASESESQTPPEAA